MVISLVFHCSWEDSGITATAAETSGLMCTRCPSSRPWTTLRRPWSISHKKLNEQVGQAQDDDAHVED